MLEEKYLKLQQNNIGPKIDQPYTQAEQSEDKINFEYFKANNIDNPTTRGIPRMYDLNRSLPVRNIMKSHNIPDSQYDYYYDLQRQPQPYSQYRQKYPFSQEYGYINPDEQDFHILNQEAQNSNQHQLYDKYNAFKNTNQPCYQQTQQTNYENNKIYNNELPRYYQTTEKAEQINETKINYDIPHQKDKNVTRIHIGLDHPENPHKNNKSKIEKRTVHTHEYIPLYQRNQPTYHPIYQKF